MLRFACVLVLWLTNAAYGDWSTLYQAACRVSNPDGGKGSGCTYYTDDSFIYVLTNQHVVGNAATVYCEFWRQGVKSSPLAGTVIWRYNRNGVDAAVIRIPREAFGGCVPPAIPFGRDPIPGQDVVSVGCPAGSWPTLWHGRVVEVRETVWWQPGRHVVSGFDITKGRSGSAVCTADGKRIVALLAWGDGRPEISGGMPISRVIAAMRGERLSPAATGIYHPLGDPSRFVFAGRLRDDAHALAKIELLENARLDWSKGVPWAIECTIDGISLQCYMLEGLRWSGWYVMDRPPAGERLAAATWSTPAPAELARRAEELRGQKKAEVIAREQGRPVGPGGDTQCPGGICPRPGPGPAPTPPPTPWPDLPPTPGGGADAALTARVEALERRLAAAEPVVEELRRLYAEYRDKWPEIKALVESTGSTKLRELMQRIEEFDGAIRSVGRQVQQQEAETTKLRAALDAAKERVLSPDFLIGIVDRVAATRRENPDSSLKEAIVATVRAELAGVTNKSGADVAGIAAGVGIPSAAAAAIGIAWAVAMRRRSGRPVRPLEVIRLIRAVKTAVKDQE